jgi:hypothetical protein
MSEDYPFEAGGFPEEPEPDGPPPDLNERRIVDPRTLPARFHHLKAAGVSGAHALLSFQEGSLDSLARRLGSGAHAILLGKPWVPYDQPSKASLKRRETAQKKGLPLPPITKAPRSGDDWKEFVANNPGKVIMTPAELAKASAIADAIKAHPIASRLLFTGDVIMERSIVWAQNGRARQSTPDARRADGSHNAEVKTTRSAHPLWFLRDAAKYAYHAQLADQAAAIEYETGKAPEHSYIIAVESAPPHLVQVFEAVPMTLEKGEQLCSIWLDKLQVFEATGQWGGYSDRIEPWELVEPMEMPVADPDWMSDDAQKETT